MEFQNFILSKNMKSKNYLISPSLRLSSANCLSTPFTLYADSHLSFYSKTICFKHHFRSSDSVELIKAIASSAV